uniref:Uncharacterized protein n=1 Tax=Pantoea phage Survivor TaxID=3232176 RepID=A0AAU8L0X3_9CAUD
MPIMIPEGNPYYYTDEFKTIIRSCKEILLEGASYAPFVERNIVFAYRFNFHKFLRELRNKEDGQSVPEDMIWVVSFINGIEDPTADWSYLQGIYIPTRTQVDSLVRINRVIRE